MDLSENMCLCFTQQKSNHKKIWTEGKNKMITKKENEDYILYFAGNTLIFSENKKTGETKHY